ncbi:30S ribosomal protein S2 [Rickettsiales endosymbiont of Paramecium tredecaurelia]|uniref:30S ribosomal protein S2 n=1 Tax=Candidatus Sarmatiella mevalonica TaxID=2770581 RepID=UPI0019250815|nr:30S ribosomal protein S2 [Candidatus Sarmatiella mevalonica]MBL3284640.1 30S ribosomal protein S2 [Candidatus Sarmatiella mevalonica]
MHDYSKIPPVTIQDLVDASIHFGHKTDRWNPKMAPYIYGIKDSVHIIDLRATAALLRMALQQVYEVSQANGKILFVCTKRQGAPIIQEAAKNCNHCYMVERWPGGTLTNYQTISKSIRRLDALEELLSDPGLQESYTKKEILNLTRAKDKLLKAFGGIRNLGSGKPNLMIVFDVNKDKTAILEAKKQNVPVIGIVDTNSNPDLVQFPIPGNDDAMRSIRLYCDLFSQAALNGARDALAASGGDVKSEITSRNTSGIKRIQSSPRQLKKVALDKNDQRAFAEVAPVAESK